MSGELVEYATENFTFFDFKTVFVTEKQLIFFSKITNEEFMPDVKSFRADSIFIFGHPISYLACLPRFIVLHRNFRYP